MFPVVDLRSLCFETVFRISTICGLPFKKLDKKSEKQAMFTRRQELTQALEGAAEGKLVLDLTVMLLFQQVSRGIFCGHEHSHCPLKITNAICYGMDRSRGW